MKTKLGAADKAMRIFGPKDKTALEKKDRQQFQMFMARTFAPYAHFRRCSETGGYLSHSVAVAWRIWGESHHSPYRPDLSGINQKMREEFFGAAPRRAPGASSDRKSRVPA